MANPLGKILHVKTKNILIFVIILVCDICWLCCIAGHRKCKEQALYQRNSECKASVGGTEVDKNGL